MSTRRLIDADFVDTVPVVHEAHALHNVRTGCVGACQQGRSACKHPAKCTTQPAGYSRAWWIAVLLCLAAALFLAIAPPAEARPINCTASRPCV